jgi:DNA polymerase-3 subunit beta
MEIALSCQVPADVESEGVVVVPAKSLLELVRRMPAGLLALEAVDDGPELAISFGSADYRLATLSARDFPDIAPLAGGEQVTLDRVAFAETVASVARAASRDESRPVYTGISLTVAQGYLTLVATDGHRLAVKTTPVDADVEIADLLIPARALEELARLPTSDNGLVICVAANRVAFDVGGFTLTSRRLDGHFQPYQQLLDAAFAHVATMPRELLLEAVERAMVMVARNSPVELTFDADDVVVQVTTAELGRARERFALV